MSLTIITNADEDRTYRERNTMPGVEKYSVDDLDYQLKQRYGMNGKEIQKSDDEEDFNIWEAYSYLKGYCGMIEGWLRDEEYKSRLKNIKEILKV